MEPLLLLSFWPPSVMTQPPSSAAVEPYSGQLGRNFHTAEEEGCEAVFIRNGSYSEAL